VRRIRFRKISRRHLDVEFSGGDGIVVRIVERPALWMPPAETARMVEELRAVVTRVLGGRTLDYGVFRGDASALEQAVVTLVYEPSTRRPVAFNALPLMRVSLRGHELDVMHLGLAMVDPDHRGRGFSAALYGLTCLLLFIRNQLRPMWITSVTQVPSVVGLVTETFRNVYPSPDPRQRRTYDHLMIAREVMKNHRGAFGVAAEADFDEQRFVIKRAYTGGSDNLKKSFAEAQRHRIDAYNRMCERELDYEVGDDFLQIGQIDLGAARNFLTRNVPRSWARALVGPLASSLFDASLLPVLHWLTPHRSMGDLRPAPYRTARKA
jgi:hypothetical protein